MCDRSLSPDHEVQQRQLPPVIDPRRDETHQSQRRDGHHLRTNPRGRHHLLRLARSQRPRHLQNPLPRHPRQPHLPRPRGCQGKSLYTRFVCKRLGNFLTCIVMSDNAQEYIEGCHSQIIEVIDRDAFIEVGNCYCNKLYKAGYILCWTVLAESLRHKIKLLADLSYRPAQAENARIDKLERDHRSADVQIIERRRRASLFQTQN